LATDFIGGENPKIRYCNWWGQASTNKEIGIGAVYKYGTHEQVKSVRKHLTDSDLLYVLDHAAPGVMDARSWSHWNMMLNRYPSPPMPQRRF
jgi:hypothetical protein